jgi:CubicO group peptidase (beta-lactamase class C family)
MLRSRDWLRHILSQRLVSKPGTEFAYSGASSHLLSAIVTETTGQSALDYARAKLFGPLGIDVGSALVQPIRTWPPSSVQLRAYARRRWPGTPTRRAPDRLQLDEAAGS